MPLTLVSTSSPAFNLTVNTSGSVVIVEKDVFLDSGVSFGSTIAMAGSTDVSSLTIYGYLTNTVGGSAIFSDATGTRNSITIAEGGFVTSYGQSSPAISVVDGSMTITNQGTIESTAVGISFSGVDVNILNTGLIKARISGAELNGTGATTFVNNGIISQSATAINSSSDFARLTNNGFLSGNIISISSSGENARITNSGTIDGTTAGIFAFGENSFVENSGLISANLVGIQASPSFGLTEVRNSGTISTTQGTGIFAEGAIARVINSGRVEAFGPSAAIDLEAQFDGSQLLNTGTVIGAQAIETTNFTDFVVNSGYVAGAINLLDGDDVYDGRGGETVGEVFGGAGEDRLLGGSMEDRLIGGANDDFLNGKAEDDILEGGDGVDTIYGGTGDDRILGGDGADILRGGDGADTIFSGDGADNVRGGDGNDTIYGEGGIFGVTQSLRGDAGNDTIIGSIFRDTINGGGDDDTLEGREGDDFILGGSGDDTVIGGLGNDSLRGGDGEDTAVFNGLSSDYLMFYGPNGTLKIHENGGTATDGFNDLYHFEFLQFDDGVYSLAELGL